MIKNEVFAIGIMSGTSLDGIDFVYVKFDTNNHANFKILETTTISYSTEWKVRLQNAISFSTNALQQLDVDYGKFVGDKTILIDDYIKNVNEWKAKGGIGIHHRDARATLVELKNILLG